MSWTLNAPPAFKTDAVSTEKGWEDPDTGEVLVAIRGLASKAGAADIIAVEFVSSTLSQGDLISVRVRFNEKVSVTAGATIVVTGDVGNVTLYAAAQSSVQEVIFNKESDNTTNETLAVGAFASGVLTSTGVNVANGETVTIGAKVYTFQTTLTNVDGNVQLGADAEETLINLVDAINLEGTPGTQYATLMTVHPTVSAEVTSATSITVTALTQGVAGNAIASTETSTVLSWGAATLAGGVSVNALLSIGAQTLGGTVLDASSAVKATGVLTLTDNPANDETVTIGAKVYTFKTTLTNTNGFVQRGSTAIESLTNLVAAINLSGVAGVQYAAATTLNADVTAVASNLVMTLTAKTAGTAGNSIATEDTLANGEFDDTTLLGGTAGVATNKAISAGIATAAGTRAVAI